MSELGALLMHAGDVKLVYIYVFIGNPVPLLCNNRLAAQWWERALAVLVGVADRHLVSAATVVESCGLWGCLLAGVLTTRLAQLSYHGNVIIKMTWPLCLDMCTTMNLIITKSTFKCLQNFLR